MVDEDKSRAVKQDFSVNRSHIGGPAEPPETPEMLAYLDELRAEIADFERDWSDLWSDPPRRADRLETVLAVRHPELGPDALRAVAYDEMFYRMW